MRPSALPVCCCGGHCHRAVQPPGELIMNRLKQSLSFLLSFCLVLTTAPGALAYQADQTSAQVPVQAATQAPTQLQQLVAPIGLWKQIDGCNRTRISRENSSARQSINNPGTQVSKPSRNFLRCSATWTRTSPGHHRWAMPTSISHRT